MNPDSSPAQGIEAAIPRKAAQAIGWAGLAAAAAIVLWQIQQNPDYSFTDEYGYLAVARDAWTRPAMIFNGWGRTFNTLALMPAARISLAASRVWVALYGLAALALAWSFAARAGLRLACLVPWLGAFQPQFIETGWGAIPQIPASLVLIGALWLTQAGRWRAAALVAGLLPLVRYQAISLTAGFAAIFLLRRQRLAALLALVPLAAVNLAGLAVTGKLPILFFFGPQQAALEYSDAPPQFFPSLLHGAGPALLFLLVLGLLEAPRRFDLMLLAGICGLYVLVHVTAVGSGLSPIANHLLFLTPLIPGGAILAAAGAESAVGRGLDAIVAGAQGRNGPARTALARYALVALCLGIAIAALLGDLLAPRELNAASIDIDRAVEYVAVRGLGNRPLVAAAPRFYYKTGRLLPDPVARPGYNAIPLESMEPGTLVVWDIRFGEAFGLPIRQLSAADGFWKQIWKSPTAAIYEKQAAPATGGAGSPPPLGAKAPGDE